MGDPGAIYAYSGLNLTHYKWSPDVLKIRDSVQKLNSVKLNSVLINYYRDGNAVSYTHLTLPTIYSV